ncbi:MAG: hypothetical protein J6W27_00175 [Alphaproteobacteria bacterium]|nr:hypothetical protein [Alphaproteobacteria bacterium]
MKKLLFVMMAFVCCTASAKDSPMIPTPSPAPMPTPCVSVFSTTVDWEGVTGLRLRQYNGTVTGMDKQLVKQGLILYYLDSFPCYGEADSVRVWLSPNGKMDGKLRLVCIHKPETISFAWRNADKDATDAVTEGILTCKIDGKKRDFTIDISKCEQGKKWKEYK